MESLSPAQPLQQLPVDAAEAAVAEDDDDATFSKCLRLAGEIIYFANKTRFYYDHR
jgi:hypothetical protein